jgi:hypothetical protein
MSSHIYTELKPAQEIDPRLEFAEMKVGRGCGKLGSGENSVQLGSGAERHTARPDVVSPSD